MSERRRTEAEAGYRSGNQGERREGFRGLRGSTGVGHQVYLPGEGDDGGGRRLAGGGGKTSKGAEELGEAKEDIGEGGSDSADIGGFLQGRGATSLIIRGQDMGSHPKDGKGANRVSTRGG